jgi:hypothetical protein
VGSPQRRCQLPRLRQVNKTVLTLLLSLTCTCASATWVKVTSNDVLTGYIDPATIARTRDGDKIRVWELIDYKTTQDKSVPYFSTKGQAEYDCAGTRQRILLINAYTGHLAKGEIVNTKLNGPPDWTPILPGSVAEAMWKLVCNRRSRIE